MSTTSLIIIQPTPFCNIDCTYCYLPNRRDRTKLEAARMDEIFHKLFAFPTVADCVTVVWHGGEPLVLGAAYYEEAFSRIRAASPANLKVEHCIQTNGLLLDEAWYDLIKRWNVKLGLSIDGPAHIHDLSRRRRSGRGTFDAVVKSVEELNRREIPFYVLTVLTRAAFENPADIFHFYKKYDIQDIGFNIEELEGANHTSGLSRDFDEANVARFFTTFRELMEKENFFPMIRELEETMTSVRHFAAGGPMNNLVTPLGIVTIGVNGDVFTFCPELAGFSCAEFPTFAIGNIFEHSYEQLRDSEVLKRMQAEIEKGVERCRAECRYFVVCGGGAPSNKMFENGSFDSTETMNCRLTKQRVTDFILGMVEGKLARQAQ